MSSSSYLHLPQHIQLKPERTDYNQCSTGCCRLNPDMPVSKCCFTAQLSVSAERSVNLSATLAYDFATATTSSLYPNTQFTNHESLPTLQEALNSFLGAFPQYLQTAEADQIRRRECPHLSLSSTVCLDYVGHGLFTYAQQRGNDHTSVASTSSAPRPAFTKVPSFELSYKPTLMNSHSENGDGGLSFDGMVRRRIMEFLNLSDEDYSLVFTANQLSAFTILADSYPFKNNKKIVTVYDHENEAVEAMTERLKQRGAQPISAEFKWPTLKIQYTKLREVIINKKKKKKGKRGLLVFPLQSRVTGARYSYQWMNMAQENDWHVLLDATALGPKDMDTLGLSLFQPDFLICTCYKAFGIDPYGFCCLIVKKSNSFTFDESNSTSSKGIVNLVLSSPSPNYPPDSDLQLQKSASAGKFSGEFHRTGGGQCEIQFKGLDIADSMGLVLISTRTRYLINWLINALLSLHYPTSHQLVKIYGSKVRFDRAPILAFNLFDWKGEKVDPILVQKLADRNHISVGCGFVKHIWFSERYESERARVLERGEKGGSKNRKDSEECGIGVMTIAVGFLNNFEDVYGLWRFVSRFLDADFVEKERWRYIALNQRTVEI